MNLNITDADNFFSTHLDGESWSAASETRRGAALAMAAGDVAVRLGIETVDERSADQCHAVFEQAVFLLRHFDRISRASGEIASESLDDVGSRSYRRDPHPGMSPRAMQLLRRLAGGGRAITRG